MIEKKIDNTIELRSEVVQEILTDPPSWIIRWGISLVFFFVIILVALSFLVQYPDFLTAQIVLTTRNPTERVVSRFSGPLESVSISNGDTISAGERLAIFKNTGNNLDINVLKGIVDSVQLDSNRVSFPVNITTRLDFGEVGPAYTNFEKSYVNYILNNELDPFANEIESMRATSIEISGRLQELTNQKKLLKEQLELKHTDYARHQGLFEKGVISLQELEYKKNDLIQSEKEMNSMAISISNLREAHISTNRNLKSNQISRSEEDTQLSTNLLLDFNALKRAISEWENKYVLKASINGIVSFNEFWAPGQFVNSGDVVFSILPYDSQVLVGKLVLPSQNAGKARPGQKVLIKLNNYPHQQYGTLVGKVKSISVSPNEDGNYHVYIDLPQGTMTSYGNELPLNQELVGAADIITEKLSIAERVFYKLNSVFKYN